MEKSGWISILGAIVGERGGKTIKRVALEWHVFGQRELRGNNGVILRG